MASYIQVPRDLSKVKTKIVMGLTRRQLVCFSIAAAIGIPVFFLIKKTGNNSLAAGCMMAVMLPLFFFAMYERDGKPLEVLIRYFIECVFIRPKERPYMTNNYYDALVRAYQTKEEVRKIAAHQKEKKGSRAASAGTDSRRKKTGGENNQKGKKGRRYPEDRSAIHTV